MGHLFYADNINSESWELFSNVGSRVYWSATEVEGDNNTAWRFNFDNNSGYQGKSAKIYNRGAWAVRDGDSPIAPEPTSAVLFMFGALIIEGALFFKKRKK